MEQLENTIVLIAPESALGTGVPDGDVLSVPMTLLRSSRVISTQARHVDPWGVPRKRETVAQAWRLEAEMEASPALLEWIISLVTSSADGIRVLIPETSGKNFVIEVTGERGDRKHYRGCRLAELSIRAEERKVITISAVFNALTIVDEADPFGLPDVVFVAELMPTNRAAMALTAVDWSGDPFATASMTGFSFSLFMKTDEEPTNYSPDGHPTGYTVDPWEVVAEVYCPDSASLTDAAYQGEWNGKWACRFSSAGPHVRIDHARGMVDSEDLLARDWRIRRVIFDAYGVPTNRALLSVYP